MRASGFLFVKLINSNISRFVWTCCRRFIWHFFRVHTDRRHRRCRRNSENSICLQLFSLSSIRSICSLNVSVFLSQFVDFRFEQSDIDVNCHIVCVSFCIRIAFTSTCIDRPKNAIAHFVQIYRFLFATRQVSYIQNGQCVRETDEWAEQVKTFRWLSVRTRNVFLFFVLLSSISCEHISHRT